MNYYEQQVAKSLDKPEVSSVTVSISNANGVKPIDLTFNSYRKEELKVIFEGSMFGVSFLPDTRVVKIVENLNPN